MKKLIITAALLASFALSAEETKKTSLSANCSVIETLSREIMTSRQVGVPLSKMLEITGTDALSKQITINAYSMTAYRSKEYQERAINNFANTYLLECIKREK